MQNRRCLMIGQALVLAGVLLLAGIALAQNQGGGQAGQGQVCTGGPGGTCTVAPAPKPGKQNSPGCGAGQFQKQKGRKAPCGGQAGEPTTPANPPATTK